MLSEGGDSLERRGIILCNILRAFPILLVSILGAVGGGFGEKGMNRCRSAARGLCVVVEAWLAPREVSTTRGMRTQ
jgi:hypothetical protein